MCICNLCCQNPAEQGLTLYLLTVSFKRSAALHLSPFSRKIWKYIFLKNASLLVCKAPFLHTLTIEWICICRAGGYWCPLQCNYVHTFCVKRFELSHVMDIALQKCYVLLLLLLNLKTREAHVQFDHRSSLALSSSPDCWATSWRRARLYVGGCPLWVTGGVSASRHGWSGRGSGVVGCGLSLEGSSVDRPIHRTSCAVRLCSRWWGSCFACLLDVCPSGSGGSWSEKKALDRRHRCRCSLLE